MDKGKTQILPCPKCWSRNIGTVQDGGWYVWCCSCGNECPKEKTKSEAIDAWNAASVDPADVMTRLKTAEDSLERLRNTAQGMTTLCEMIRDGMYDNLASMRHVAGKLVERAVSHREGISISDIAREMAGALKATEDQVVFGNLKCQVLARAALARAHEAGIEVPE